MNQGSIFGRISLQHLSLRNLMQFGDHLVVEHPEIDAQHKAIFQLGVGIYEDWRGGGSLDVLRPAVDKLSKLTHSHFAYEEQVLEEIGYDDLKSHSQEHQAMRDELSMVHERFNGLARSGRTTALSPGDEIMQFVLGLTVGHVGTSDMRYYRALMANGPRAACGPAARPSSPPGTQRAPQELAEPETTSDIGGESLLEFWRGADAVCQR
jgi:hemerythrin-like metal-binding protein